MKSDKPKVLHRVAGKPMVRHVIEAARRAGIKDLIAVVGHGSEQVRPMMGRLRIDTVPQDVQRGTGHAVLQAYPLLRDYSGSVLVLSGDTPLIRPETITAILEAHRLHSNTVTFATAMVPDASGYGRIVRGKSGAFREIVEERDADASVRKIKEINVGLYCFRSEPLFDALLLVRADNMQMEYYLPDAIAAMKTRGSRVEAVIIDDYTECLGVNNRKELKAVERILKERRKHGYHKRRVAHGIHRKGRG
jgi:bifunctional UDP-N-acetylglucosamine pyrophosphorylase/glucosamine-1-phosphate N-acetyltransferase